MGDIKIIPTECSQDTPGAHNGRKSMLSNPICKINESGDRVTIYY